MPNKTNIEWTDFSSSLLKYRDESGRVVWHCEKTSPGCTHCYSETIAERFNRGGPFLPMVTPKVTPFFDEAEAKKILRSKSLAGKRVFVNDMTDWMGAWVSDEIIWQHMAVFAVRQDVTFQTLTKRADRQQQILSSIKNRSCLDKLDAAARTLGWSTQFEGLLLHDWPLRNLHCGVSVEDQQRADQRIPLLLRTPAAVRFLSCEPLLGPVRVDQCAPYTLGGDDSNPGVMNGFNGLCHHPATTQLLPDAKGSPEGISWVIVGGESGHGARPMQIEWARSLVAQCRAAGVACFVKQLGARPVACAGMEWPGLLDPPVPGQELRCVDRKGGDWSEWPADLRVRQWPEVQQ